MIKFLSNKRVLIGSMIMTTIMFTVVMFLVNPAIDSHNGFGVLKLQIAFDKEVAIDIVESWGVHGVEQFQKLIFTDYLYALSYSIFLASLISYLTRYKNIKNEIYKFVIYLVFLAGLIDWIENTMELFFLDNMIEYSSNMFFMHSILASIKWLALPIILSTVIILVLKKKA